MMEASVIQTNRGGKRRFKSGTIHTAEFERALQALQVTAFNFSYRMINDGRVRLQYQKQIKAVSSRLRDAVASGKLSPSQAALEATRLRNHIMEVMRGRSSDIGRAMAQSIKDTGKSLQQLLDEKAARLFKTSFSNLSPSQQNAVFLEIVESAGRANPAVSKSALRNLKYGRALFAVSLAISTYNILTAENKVKATAHEGALLGGGALGGGALGGAAGGAAAGALCGPGAPICVGVGIFVGGILGALGIDFVFEWASGS